MRETWKNISRPGAARSRAEIDGVTPIPLFFYRATVRQIKEARLRR
jgi:hypothetical protein